MSFFSRGLSIVGLNNDKIRLMARVILNHKIFAILLCFSISLSIALIPANEVKAQTATPPPAMIICLGQSKAGEGAEAISLQSVSAITLVYFCIEYQPESDQVLVTWETATELDTSGYFIWRSDTENGTYEAKSPFIQAEGGVIPTTYEWLDSDAEIGNVYYYKLEEINTDNVSVYFYGPVRFDFYSPTPTPTDVNSLTSTPTRTATPTAVKSPTATFTRTPTPFTLNSGLLFTPSPSPSQTLAATQDPANTDREGISVSLTATLQPLPPIQLLFPAPTATPPGTELAMLQVSQGDESPIDIPANEIRPNLTSRVWLLGGIVLLLWIVLGTFLVLYLRKAQG